MLIRPTAQTVGLTEKHLERLRTLQQERDHLRKLISTGGTVIIGICFAIWIFFPGNTEGVLVRSATVVFVVILGWAFVFGILHGISGLLLRKPDQYSKVEAYDKAVITFESDWRKDYWRSFWDSISLRSYHVEPENDVLTARRLGFVEYWNIPCVPYFCVLNGKRHVIYTVPQDIPFDLKAAQKAVDTLTFHCADVMCLISPNGFIKEAIEYLAKKHPKKFLLQIGQEAVETVSLLKTLKLNASGIPLDVVAKTGDLLKTLKEWQAKREPETGGV